MRRFAAMTALTVGLLITASPAIANIVPAHDMAGSHDSPIVSRFAGSVIVGYQARDFDQLTLPLGKAVGHRLSRSETVQGKIIRIAYMVPPGKSAFEVWRNYRRALESAGFKPRFFCTSSGYEGSTDGAHGCGGTGPMLGRIVPERLIEALAQGGPNGAGIEATIQQGNRIFLETARLKRSSGLIDLMVLVSHQTDRPVGVLLEICRAKAMTTDEVSAMQRGLAQDGHFALYGIHFATNSARITAASDPTLALMAKLMRAQPGLKVYIVGNTDDTGTLTHNLALSQARAESVVKALMARGIAPSRMAAKGIASYAPVATNGTAAGRAKNRRVELVEQ